MASKNLKQLAVAITDGVITRFENADAAKDANNVYRKDAARLKLNSWIESVSNISLAELDRAITAGKKVRVEYDGREYLPADLRIVKEFRNISAAEPLIEAHDRNRTNIPFEKLFNPSLFPELDYAEIRTGSLVLGDNNRVEVGLATPEQWRIHDDIEQANYVAQTEAHEKYRDKVMRRDRGFARYPDCKNTDQLMKKLGARW
jgi:hypothetical protein